MRLGRRRFLAYAGAVCLAGCGSASVRRKEPSLTWGGPGRRNGEFIKPRAIGEREGEVFVIDMTGRIQVFSEDGRFLRLWSVPESENGTPTSLAFDGEGNLVVPDTHYHRMLRYSRRGELLEQWGSFGAGPDQFVYPTDAAVDADGTIYISEYGEGAERIHVVDAHGRFVRQWGAFGEAPGEFNRSMAIEGGSDASLFVCDTGNNRVQRFDASGKLLGVIGGPGTEPGRLKAPFGLALTPDGALLVCEYGTCRISRFAPDGTFVTTLGEPGREPGQFNDPRGIAVAGSGNFFVADTGNHRIQRFPVGDVA